MRNEISDEDMAQTVAFVDGAMSSEERTRFELRLAAEPALAAAVEAFSKTDELVRRAGRSESSTERMRPFASRQRRPAWMWPAALAAAALLVFGLARWIENERAPRVDCLVALAPSFESAEDFVASRSTLGGLHPPGLGSLRGPSEQPNIGASEFVQKAHALEEKAAGSASSAPIKAGYFVIPIQAQTNCSVVVLGFPSYGNALRYFPELGDLRPVAEQGRVAAGDHTLPYERIVLVAQADTAASVRYNRGFLVPIGAQEVIVVVAVRVEALDDKLLKSIDEALLRGDTASVMRTLLEQSGFQVSDRIVFEP